MIETLRQIQGISDNSAVDQDPREFNFLDYTDPAMGARAASLRLEAGRLFINDKKVRVYSFLRRAETEGAIQQVGEDVGPERFRKLREISWFSLFTDGQNVELGPVFGYSASDEPASTFKNFVKKIHNRSSENTRQEFPLEEMIFKKKVTQRLLDKKSAQRGGKRGEIRRLVQEGETDFRKISKLVGLNEERVIIIMSQLRSHGVIRRHRRSTELLLARKINNADSPEDVPWMLRRASPNLLQTSPSFSTLTAILERHNLRALPQNIKLIASELKARGVSGRRLIRKSGKVQGYYYANLQEEDIVSIVMESEEIQELLVH